MWTCNRWDYNTPIKETISTLDDLVRSGKVRYIGASSMYAWQFQKALYTSDAAHLSRFISMQNQYSLLYREEEREMIPLCRDQGVGVIPFCPLARGLLTRPPDSQYQSERSASDPVTGKYYTEEHDNVIRTRVHEVATKKNATMAQVSLKWVLDSPGITSPIVGATTPAQLDDLVQSFKIKLDAEDREYLQAAYRPRPLLNVL